MSEEFNPGDVKGVFRQVANDHGWAFELVVSKKTDGAREMKLRWTLTLLAALLVLAGPAAAPEPGDYVACSGEQLQISRCVTECDAAYQIVADEVDAQMPRTKTGELVKTEEMTYSQTRLLEKLYEEGAKASNDRTACANSCRSGQRTTLEACNAIPGDLRQACESAYAGGVKNCDQTFVCDRKKTDEEKEKCNQQWKACNAEQASQRAACLKPIDDAQAQVNAKEKEFNDWREERMGKAHADAKADLEKRKKDTPVVKGQQRISSGSRGGLDTFYSPADVEARADKVAGQLEKSGKKPLVDAMKQPLPPEAKAKNSLSEFGDKDSYLQKAKKAADKALGAFSGAFNNPDLYAPGSKEYNRAKLGQAAEAGSKVAGAIDKVKDLADIGQDITKVQQQFKGQAKSLATGMVVMGSVAEQVAGSLPTGVGDMVKFYGQGLKKPLDTIADVGAKQQENVEAGGLSQTVDRNSATYQFFDAYAARTGSGNFGLLNYQDKDNVERTIDAGKYDWVKQGDYVVPVPVDSSAPPLDIKLRPRSESRWLIFTQDTMDIVNGAGAVVAQFPF